VDVGWLWKLWRGDAVRARYFHHEITNYGLFLSTIYILPSRALCNAKNTTSLPNCIPSQLIVWYVPLCTQVREALRGQIEYYTGLEKEGWKFMEPVYSNYGCIYLPRQQAAYHLNKKRLG
jgi:hypothetical protein